MSDIKFSCPQCSQHIQCDEQSYGGMEIPCPACGAKIVVPGSAATPPPIPIVPGAGQRYQSRAPGTRAPAALPGSTRAASSRGPARKPDWYKTPYPYAGLLVVSFGVLYFFARQNQMALLGFLLGQIVYSLTMHIIVVVHAFKNHGVGVGFATLCIPFFAIYYVFSKSESPTLKLFYGLTFLLILGVLTLKPA